MNTLRASTAVGAGLSASVCRQHAASAVEARARLACILEHITVQLVESLCALHTRDVSNLGSLILATATVVGGARLLQGAGQQQQQHLKPSPMELLDS